MNKKRTSYDEIRSGFMSCFYVYRRDKIKDMNNHKPASVNQSTEVGYAYYQWEDSYDLPIEMLMRDVFTLIMLAGCTSDIVKKNLSQGIQEIIEEYSLDILLQGISDDEKLDLLYDMELLELIDKRSE